MYINSGGFFGFQTIFLSTARLKFSKIHFVVKLPVDERLNNFRAIFSLLTLIYDEPLHLLDTLASQCIRICSTFCILCFSCQGKSRDIVYQVTCLLSWLIFAEPGLFEIQLTAYSARSRLTDHGIYYIIRCGI